ncbi:type II toxin-antitoxin system HicB family antitoxin [Leptolyngbya sp. FACHB-17]|uniref:type II toxin-antitoxin system HicB family antitoxin n=1 Tax=unclassified Leptolyngbya TaxID=2650499 RepID=UPI00168018CE|nr:type II toxin-antitoxin system HicB family antitoxin [Leptolyngbya sp. FACHB-17]MBD2082491.1 type II toxin-antitoxin system HicB family antitoxin [Leptolyngbya sp. FACHB-17]
MQYQVFVQNPPQQQFAESVVNVPGVMAEGQTKEEALAKLARGTAKAKAMLEEKLARGEFVTIEVESRPLSVEANPWRKHQGIFADDPTFDDFLAEVEAYRRSVDAQEIEETKE